MQSFVFLAADSALGRIDTQLLSDQTMMELLFEGLSASSKQTFFNSDGTYRDFKETNVCMCDADGNINKVFIEKRTLQDPRPNGTIALEFIPRRVFYFQTENCQLEGTLQCSSLPHTLEKLNLRSNRLSGGVSFADMPAGVTLIEIARNNFSGSLDVTSLPASLSILNASYNQFSGSISLDHLPSTLYSFYVGGNKLTGSFCLLNVPRQLEYLYAGQNSFERRATVHSSIAVGGVSLRDSGISEILNENGEHHTEERAMIKRFVCV